MSRCYDCRKPVKSGVFRCKSCLKDIKQSEDRRRRGLTEWEEMKLGWYRDEKKWNDNISRRKVVEKNGKRVTVLTDHRGNIIRQMPRQPDHLKKAPQIYQPQGGYSQERIDR